MPGMKNPDKLTLEKLRSARHEFIIELIRKWCEQSLQMLRKENDIGMGLELTRNQGSIHTIKDILKVIGESPENPEE